MLTQKESEDCTEESYPTCAKAAETAAENEETSMAFLLALLPVLTLTFFGQVGLL